MTKFHDCSKAGCTIASDGTAWRLVRGRPVYDDACVWDNNTNTWITREQAKERKPKEDP